MRRRLRHLNMTQLKPIYGLHDYQQQVLDEILDAITPIRDAVVQPQRRVVAHLPTGAGKTRSACHAACRILSNYHAVGKVVIWLASTEELCQQASDDLAHAWEHLGSRPANRYEIWGNRNLDPSQLTGWHSCSWTNPSSGRLPGMTTISSAVCPNPQHWSYSTRPTKQSHQPTASSRNN